MRLPKSSFLCVFALFLSGSTIYARTDAGNPGEISDPVGRVDMGNEKAGDGEAPNPLVAGAGQNGYQALTGKERWDLYLRDAFWSPGVFFKATGPALGAQLKNEPAAWGQGMEGYSKRFGNRFGRFALQETYEAAGAAILHHEVRYIRSERSGFLPRAAYALTANFVTYDRSGRRTPHIARVGSVVAAEFTGNLWMPAGYRGTATAMRGVGVELGVSSAFNLVREFAPELRRIFTRR